MSDIIALTTPIEQREIAYAVIVELNINPIDKKIKVVTAGHYKVEEEYIRIQDIFYDPYYLNIEITGNDYDTIMEGTAIECEEVKSRICQYLINSGRIVGTII